MRISLLIGMIGKKER